MAVGVRALSIDCGIHAMIAQNAYQKAHIRKIGHVLKRDCVRREHACDHKRQSCVLSSAYRDCAIEALTASYANSVHILRRDRVARRPHKERHKLSLSFKRRWPASQGFGRLVLIRCAFRICRFFVFSLGEVAAKRIGKPFFPLQRCGGLYLAAAPLNRFWHFHHFSPWP